MSFDVAAARQAGYSDLEIADFLGQQRGFDTAAARRAGYSNADILSYLNTRLAPTMPVEAGRPTTQPSTAEQAGRSGLQRNIFDPVERGFQNLMIGAATTRALSPDSILGLNPEEAAAAIARRQRRLAEIPRTEASQRAFREAEETESVPGAVGRLASSSAALGDIGLESLGTNPLAAPVGALANVTPVPVLRQAIGALAGALGFPTEYLTSVSNGVMEAAQRRGVDVSDPAQLSALLREINANPELRGDIRSDALVRAGIISAADVAAGYGAGRVVSRGALGRVGGGAAIEAAGGGFGEAGAQLATEGRISPAEIAAEIIGGAGMGALGNIRQSPTPGQDPALQSAIEQIVRSRGGAQGAPGTLVTPPPEPPEVAPTVETAPVTTVAPPTAAPAIVGQGNLFAQPGQPARPEVAAPEAAAPEVAPTEAAPTQTAAPAQPQPATPQPQNLFSEIGTPAPAQAAPQADTFNIPVGRQFAVSTPDGSMSVDVVPEVVDLFSLNPATGALQNRMIDNPANQATINNIANAPDFTRLGTSPFSDRGAPIIGPDNIIEIGNHRVEGLKRAAENNPQAYQGYVRALNEAGYDTRGMQFPVLIRRRVGELDPTKRQDFTRLSNSEANQSLSDLELAKQDASRLTPELLGKFDGEVSGGVRAAKNLPFVRDFLSQITTPSERTRLISPEGGISDALADRLERALFASAYNDIALIKRAVETGDDDTKSITGGMIEATGAMQELRRGVESGRIRPEFDIVQSLVKAADRVRAGKANQLTPADILSTEDMINPIPAIERELIKLLSNDSMNKIASKSAIGKRLKAFVEEAKTQTTDQDLVGGERRISPEEAAVTARNPGQVSMFSARGTEARAEAPALSAKQKQAQEKAQRVVNKFLNDLRSRSRQARIFAADLDRLLRDRTMTPEQIYRGFMVADTLANTIPGRAEYRLKFEQDIIVKDEKAARASGAKVGDRAQGRVIYPEKGSAGIIELSLSKDMLPLLNETAAHEGFHILQTYFAEYDKAFADRINKSFKEDMKISDLEPSIKRRLQALKPPGSKVSYYDSLVQGLGDQPLSAKEAQAYAFGSLVDAANRGKPTAGILPPFQRFVLFAKEFMAKLKSALNKDGFESAADLLVSAQRRGARMTQAAPSEGGAAYSGQETRSAAAEAELNYRRGLITAKERDAAIKDLGVRYEVIDRRDPKNPKVVGSYSNRARAWSEAEKRNLQYGAQRFSVNSVAPEGAYSARSTVSSASERIYQRASEILKAPVVYKDDEVALIEAISGNHNSIYIGVNGESGSRTLVDIKNYKEDFRPIFSPEQRKRLLDARASRVAEVNRLTAENKSGPFAESNMAFGDEFPQNLRGFADGIVKELGLSGEKIFFFTFDEAGKPDFASKYKLYGDYQPVKSLAFYPERSPGIYGLAMTPGDKKYRAIAIESSKRLSAQMETLAHEIGHVFDSVALQKASPETIREIEASFRKWLGGAKNNTARDYMRLLRTPVVGKLQSVTVRKDLDARYLDNYFRSFEEWFADQVARWSLTSEPAKTLIGKFFQRIAAAYRALVNRLGATAQPDATVAKFIEQRRAATRVVPLEPQASFGFDKPRQGAFGFAGPGKPEQTTFGFSVGPNLEDVEVAAPEQRISSAGTSVKQIPATFKTVNFKPGTVNLDYGGGRYDLGTDYLREKGVESFVYDKFNRSEEHNRDVLARVGQGGADTVTVNNVLNVVAEPEVRDFIIQDAGRYLKPDGTAYFLVYEGDKSGTGKETSKGFQNNAKAEDYIPAIQEHFGQVSRKGNLIAAKSPKASASGQAARTQYSARQVAPQYAARVSGQVAGLAPFGQRTPPATMSATQRAELNVQYDVVSKALSKRFGRFIPPAKIESFFMKFQDKMLPVGRMIDEIREAGGNITVAMDAYLKEDLLQGKVATMLEKRSKDLYNPLVKAVADSGLSMQDFENFLYARHAPERNKYVASINPDMPDGGSGLTNQQAKDMMREFQQQGKTAKLTELAKMFDAIIADTNKLRVEAGLTPDFSIIKTTEDGRPLPDYKDYAPLRNFVQESVDGEETVKEFRPKSGKALGARGREDKRVTGRERLAGDILAHAMMQNTQAVIRSEQNKVGQSFLAMIRANPDQSKGFAEVITSAPLRTTIVNGVVKTMPDPTYKNDPDVLVVKENGKEVAIRIFDENVARAMTGASALSPASKNILVQGMASVNRFLAKVNTAYNPEFLITNFARDLQTFGINVQQFDVDGLTKDVMGDLKGALSGIRDVTRNKNNNPEMARYFERFRELGGTTDMYGFADIETRIAEINEVMSKVGTEAKSWKDMAKAVQPVIKFLEDYNTIVENGVRTALFKNLVERGFNEEQAAQAAKNITVNFSKGGENRVFMNAMYLFYNASLQGTMAMVNAIGRSPKVRKIVAAVVVAGVLQDVLNSMLSGEDDDDEKIYDKIPDHILKRSFVMIDPFQITERGYFSFPMPYGFNAFFNMGREMSKTARGATDPMKAAGSIVGTFVDSFNPIGGSESILNFVAPTIIDPVVDIVENRDFAGRPIVPERGGFGPQPPESQKYWGNTFAPYVAISDFLNEVTGGTRVIPGAVDISPNIIQYAVNYATGGVGKFVERSFNTVTGTIPDALRGDLSEVDVKGIPLFRSLYGNVTARSDTERYMTRMEEVLRVRQEIRDASQYGQSERVEAAMRRYPGQVEIMESFNRISRERAQISQRINEINRNPNIDADSKKEIIKLLRDQQNALVGVANQLYNQSVERRQ